MGGIILGFSSRCLAERRGRINKDTLNDYFSLGVNAIELSPGGDKNKIDIEEKDLDNLSDFEYVSLHLPNDTGELLQDMLSFVERWKHIFKTIVVHPDIFSKDGFFDYTPIKDFELPFAFENMDPKKTTGQDKESLNQAFDDFYSQMGYDAGFVLDVNHSFLVDPSGKLQDSLLEDFGNRLKEIHISSYITLHEPFFQAGRLELLYNLPNKPFIIESGFNDLIDASIELRLVKRTLERYL